MGSITVTPRTKNICYLNLIALDVARPIGAMDEVLLSITRTAFPRCKAVDVRRALMRLAALGLVALTPREAQPWHAELTAAGISKLDHAHRSRDFGPLLEAVMTGGVQ